MAWSMNLQLDINLLKWDSSSFRTSVLQRFPSSIRNCILPLKDPQSLDFLVQLLRVSATQWIFWCQKRHLLTFDMPVSVSFMISSQGVDVYFEFLSILYRTCATWARVKEVFGEKHPFSMPWTMPFFAISLTASCAQREMSLWSLNETFCLSWRVLPVT